MDEINLEGELTISDSPDADISCDSNYEVKINQTSEGFEVSDLGKLASRINGRYFRSHILVIGDFLNVNELWFLFDGFALCQVPNASGSQIKAEGIQVILGNHTILDNASFAVKPGQFAGILGPSGAGKSTLLNALSGLSGISDGSVRVDGVQLSEIVDLSSYFGYVPQQEIVHLDLTVRQALTYSALLRLPKRTPRVEIDRLVETLAERLDLSEHIDKKNSMLSGGQLKRVSVSVELLNRPPLLFLDEPTSGLDPESENEMMEFLQQLSYNGTTVVATTHLMENVYLMNQVDIVMAGLDPETNRTLPGTTIFSGKPRTAREFFEVEKLTELYRRLRDRTRDEWKEKYRSEKEDIDASSRLVGKEGQVKAKKSLPKRWMVPILLKRQWAILTSNPANLLILIGQPLLISLLIALVATGDTETPTKLFLAYIATLWFGASNAATEIVSEKAIFVREQFTGLPDRQYLTSKFLFLGAITCLQALIVFLVLALFGQQLTGSSSWQAGCLLASAMAATGIGLAISAFARSSLQAIFFVPIVIIPQILFSGFVFPVQEWNGHTFPRLVSRAMPSFSSQRIMDTSLLWDQKIEDLYIMKTKGLDLALDNLATAVFPNRAIWNHREKYVYSNDESKIYYLPEDWSKEPLGKRELTWELENIPGLRKGVIYHNPTPAIRAYFVLGGWLIATFLIALFALRRRKL